MKQKNITLTSMAIIFIMALTLIVGLSMLHVSATGDSLIPTESFIPDSPIIIEKDQPNMHEDLDKGLIDNNMVTPEGDQIDEDIQVKDENIVNTFKKCIVIDIYEHETGEYVGQVVSYSQEEYEKLGILFQEYAEIRTNSFIPNVDVVTEDHWLPKSKYRIEVMAGSIFAYSYGIENNNMMETLQCGMTFYGGEEVIKFIDSLIEDKIKEIENGETQSINEKNSIAEIEKLNLYWYGGYHDILGTYLPANNRLTPRFPYIVE